MKKMLPEVTSVSGLQTMVEPMPNVRSVAVGLWLKAGSRDDPPGKEGLAHLVEHMAFKGTVHRTALEIAKTIDALGGHLNGATTKETTVYYTTVLAEDLPTALEIIIEMATKPRFAPDDLARERTVVLEEIREAEDDPQDTVFRLLGEKLWGEGHPLGWPVIGTEHSVAELTPDDLWEFFHRHYSSSRAFLVAVGAARPEVVSELVEKFATMGEQSGNLNRIPPTPQSGLVVGERKIQQVHLALGFPTVPAGSPARYALEVVSALLGGGVSSYLFQRVREERGLVYTIFSTTAYYVDAGALTIYAAAEEEKLPKVLEVIREEIEGIGRTFPDPTDLSRAVKRLTNSLLLGLEDPDGRMFRLGHAMALGQEILPPEEVVRRLQAVTPEEVQEIASRYLSPRSSTLALVGPSADRLDIMGRKYFGD